MVPEAKSQKHTPGPWHRNIPPATKYPVVWSGRNTHVAQVVTVYRKCETGAFVRADDEMEANIRLIAAAPDMLEALRRFVTEFDSLDPRNTYQAKAIVWFRRIAASAAAALAKAEGGKS